MIPGLNPRKMQQMMKRMGIQQTDIAAKEVIIKCEDKDIIVTNPSVAKVNMMGQETFQISGNVEERQISVSDTPEISEEDIDTVVEQAGVSKEDAEDALKRHKGDIAAAILELKSKE
jgi:nascent polypeptide-associated complex subunit alpha